MFPGSVAGIPPEVETMPELLRKAGYSAHMVGKWHLGFSQWSQIPVGRGFQSHVGGFMWDLESYTKNLWLDPVTFNGKDWGRYQEDGTFHHFEEPRHATVAETEEAIARMKEHVAGEEKENPLFLYVSYNAAHSPLQPEPEWLAPCQHIKHLWRRLHCTMVVGLDNNVARVVDSAKKILGENTVVVFSSDNGASVWFGGLNAPLRSGKFTTFEGGVRVPAFLVDFSSQYSRPGQEVKQLVHISDWLPTFLSWAGRSDLLSGLHLDGLDQSPALTAPGTKVREEMVLELVEPENTHDKIQNAAYRAGQYKIMQGNVRDPCWYSEPSQDTLVTTDTSSLPGILERTMKLTEEVWGSGPTDSSPHRLLSMGVLFSHYSLSLGVKTFLFDLENDPEERTDLSKSRPKLLRKMLDLLELQRQKRQDVVQQKYWILDDNWANNTANFKPGDCSAPSEKPRNKYEKCLFVHPWVEDSKTSQKTKD